MARKFDVLAGLALQEWCREKPGRQEELGQKLRVSGATVSRWCTGDMRPDTESKRQAIEVLTGGKARARDWLTAEEEREARRLARLGVA